MKFKITLLELIAVWLALHVAENNGKVVGNIKDDDDGGTLTIVDIEDDNKTHYYNQNFELGNYNYGYDVKPSGPVGQFHHENRAIDEVVYGCYGYEGPDSRNHMTFYVSDAWGYRPVRQGQDIEVFYPAENPEGTGHHNGHMTKWADLLFPDMCANVAERIASSSNVVTNAPVQLATPVSPADRFVTAAGVPPSTLAPSPLSSFGGRNPPIPSGSFDVIQFNTPTAGTIGPQPTSGRLQTGSGSSTANTGFPTIQTTQPARPAVTSEQASNNNIVPNLPSASSPTGSRPTTLGSFTGARFTTPTAGSPSRPAFTGGVVQSTLTPSSSAPLPEEDVTDSQSSNDGPLLPNRPLGNGNRPVSTRGPTTTAGSFSSGPPQFSRLIPTPTEPAVDSEPVTQTVTNNRFVTTRAPATTNFNLLRTTTTASPAGPNEVPVDSRPPGRQGPGQSYGSSGDDDDSQFSNVVGTNASRQPTVATRVPSRGTTTGFQTSRNPGATGTTRLPTGSTLVTQPASSESTFPSGQDSTNTQTPTAGSSLGPARTSTGSTAVPTTGFRPSSGFSGTFNNPSTLQPSSTNTQTVPGSTSGTNTPTTFGPSSTSGTSTQQNPNRFSTTFRQTIPTTVIPQNTGASSSNPPTPTTRGSSPFSSSAPRSPTTFSPSIPTTAQFQTSRPTPSRNASASTEEFCATQCSTCSNNTPPPPPPPPQQPPTLTEDDFLRIPGALLSNIPVIFYPDCSANAYSRPAIVPFCPSHKTQCNNDNNAQPLTMRFPDAVNFALNGNGPVARNAFVENINQASNRVTRKVRRGRQQRLAIH